MPLWTTCTLYTFMLPATMSNIGEAMGCSVQPAISHDQMFDWLIDGASKNNNSLLQYEDIYHVCSVFNSPQGWPLSVIPGLFSGLREKGDCHILMLISHAPKNQHEFHPSIFVQNCKSCGAVHIRWPTNQWLTCTCRFACHNTWLALISYGLDTWSAYVRQGLSYNIILCGNDIKECHLRRMWNAKMLHIMQYSNAIFMA